MSPEAYEIRDAIVALFPAKDDDHPDALFLNVKHVRADFEPDEIPGLIIAMTRERMEAEGDLTAAQPRFIHDLSLFLGVKVAGKSREAAEERAALRMKFVLATVLSDADFIASIEGVSSIEVNSDFDRPGQGELFLAFCTAEFTVQFRSAWAPLVEDELEKILTTIRLTDDPATPSIFSEITLNT